ncbi:hypothetical protein ASG47_18340 [Devosia sp. Leaf420]|uniref:MraY family glycosyltransferase n=1 Tax=Devosia sp. Leaf420 TaxID=1736374 RepID=UPI0007123B53|nr:glycosyltransferase family 4 protein [Devosia sp. Leaf420]KQT41895.1 hypothetical protein ASG47_18340 [Devosia sp. Leaf420]
MPASNLYLVMALCFIATAAIAELTRKNAMRLGLVQVPNERSSHSVPTPSGGGLAIVLVSCCAGLFVSSGLFGIVLVCALVGLLGFLDDRLNLPAKLRLIVHFCLTSAVVSILFFGMTLDHGLTVYAWVLAPLIVIAGVWWINLFNFMDGIDGLASSQAIFMTAASFSLASGNVSASGLESFLLLDLVVLACASGFLVLNWPPARIFMGDAGSNFLAMAIFCIFLGLIAAGRLDMPAALILSALFVCDATMTLLTRILRGESGFKAHRTHAYQKLSRLPGGHRRTTLIYLAINLCWIYPLAYLAQTFDNWGWGLFAAACIPIVILCILVGAGLVDTSPSRKILHE